MASPSQTRIIAAYRKFVVRATDLHVAPDGKQSILLTTDHVPNYGRRGRNTRTYDVVRALDQHNVTVSSSILHAALFHDKYLAITCRIEHRKDNGSVVETVCLALLQLNSSTNMWKVLPPPHASKILKVSWTDDGRLLAVLDDLCILWEVTDELTLKCLNMTYIFGRRCNFSGLPPLPCMTSADPSQHNACIVAESDNTLCGTLHNTWTIDRFLPCMERAPGASISLLDSPFRSDGILSHTMADCMDNTIVCLARAPDGFMAAVTKRNVYAIQDGLATALRDPSHHKDGEYRSLAVNNSFVLFAYRSAGRPLFITVFDRHNQFAVALHHDMGHFGLVLSVSWLDENTALVVRSSRVDEVRVTHV